MLAEGTLMRFLFLQQATMITAPNKPSPIQPPIMYGTCLQSKGLPYLNVYACSLKQPVPKAT